MPCYDYKCLTCHEVFTISKSMKDESTPPCPTCGSNEKVERVWGCVNLGGMTSVAGTSSCSSCSGGSCSTCK